VRRLPSTHLRFNSNLGAKKPENIINREVACPFCDKSSLSGILDEDGSIVLLLNKYPVLEDALQTVVIETDDCNAELSEYPKEHLYKLMRFGLHHWFRLQETGDYASVLFFKNHGPYSGGTIRHPHMQIVGLKNVDYHQVVDETYIHGLEIASSGGVTLNVSTHPRVGFFEFNVLFHGMEDVETMSDFVQVATHYTLNHFHRLCQSYNLFFYTLPSDVRDNQSEGRSYAVKIVPRFVTSPLFIGYSIPQVSDRIENVANDIQQRYFS
jgi:ATP adenylyltransferase/5',5'''-P-1,P-4-tetraphosphate phosphorylase II